MNPSGKHDFFRWKPAACLRVSGEDSASFLQGQFTNDLHQSGKAEGVYGLWLNQKGKVLADSFVREVSALDFRVVSYFSPASVIRERLEAYIIADDVTVDDLTGAMEGVTFFGAASVTVPEGAWWFSGRRGGPVQVEMIYPGSSAAAVDARREGAVELSAAEVARRRIAAVIPAVPADIGPAELPNEGGLETDAISYTKGCYLGQEVMARLKSMGQVRRRLVRVRGNGLVPAVPAPVFQGGRRVGEVRSVAADGGSWIGLALVSLLAVRPQEGLALAADGATVVGWGEAR